MGKFFIIIFIFAIQLACNGEEKVRRYTEKNPNKKNGEIGSKETVKAETGRISWTTPAGWVEKEALGIRLATFDVQYENQFALCTIVSLQGDGGGIKANVLRWLAQQDLKMGSEDDLDDFILKQKRFTTEQNIPATLIDFTSLVFSSEQQTMLALILNLPRETVFVKMIGERIVLVKNLEKLLSLGNSLRIVGK